MQSALAHLRFCRQGDCLRVAVRVPLVAVELVVGGTPLLRCALLSAERPAHTMNTAASR